MNDEAAIAIYCPPERMTIDQAVLAWLDEKRADSERPAIAETE